MGFRYYIADTFEGAYKGTDSLAVARNYADSEDFYVVDTKENVMLLADGGTMKIEEGKISE